jgi:ribosomal protein S18 acetylase RimI-like enzyme
VPVPDELALRFIELSDPLFAQELSLRHRVLREPLGLPPDAVRFPFEDESLHLCALLHGQVVGCVLFHPEPGGGGRLYQMAVDPAHQECGIGRMLVEALEQRLRRDGVERIHLHARTPAAEFYRKLGYRAQGEPYLEVGLEHIMMARAL